MYWSRSRGGLWRKGDTSGAWQVLLPRAHAASCSEAAEAWWLPQTLHRIRLDCDHDALCFTVTQHGEPPAFCHKNSLTCWGDARGLRALQASHPSRLSTLPD